MKDNIIEVNTSQGRHLSADDDIYRIIISNKQKQEAYAVIDMPVPPGGGPGLHSHPGFN